MCGACGVSATHIRSGGRGVTSLDAEECAVKCPRGRAATADGDNAVASVGACEHLAEALRTQCEEEATQSVRL
jgi:hypothetical protein